MPGYLPASNRDNWCGDIALEADIHPEDADGKNDGSENSGNFHDKSPCLIDEEQLTKGLEIVLSFPLLIEV
jgi:hypothetical protein